MDSFLLESDEIATFEPFCPQDFTLIALTVTDISTLNEYEDLFAQCCRKIDENMQDATNHNDLSTLKLNAATWRLIEEQQYTVRRLNYTTFNAWKKSYTNFQPCILQGFVVEPAGTGVQRFFIQVIMQRFQPQPEENLLAVLMSLNAKLGMHSPMKTVPNDVMVHKILGKSLAHVNCLFRSTQESETMLNLFEDFLTHPHFEKVNRIFSGSALDQALFLDEDKLLSFIVPGNTDIVRDLQNRNSTNDLMTQFRGFFDEQPLFHTDPFPAATFKRTVTIPFARGNGYPPFQFQLLIFPSETHPMGPTRLIQHIQVRGIGFPDDHEFNESPLDGVETFEYFIKKCLYLQRFTIHDFIDRVHVSR